MIKHESKFFTHERVNSSGYVATFFIFAIGGIFGAISGLITIFGAGLILHGLILFIPLLIAGILCYMAMSHCIDDATAAQKSAYLAYHGLSDKLKNSLGMNNLKADLFLRLEDSDAVRLRVKIEGLVRAQEENQKAIVIRDSRLDNVIESLTTETRLVRENTEQLKQFGALNDRH